MLVELLLLVLGAAVATAAVTTTDSARAAAGACSYDRSLDMPPRPADEPRSAFPAATPGYQRHRYDDPSDFAHTSAREDRYRSAPQTTLEQPCEGMLVYRVYGPGAGAGEFGRGWSPIDPRTIGPDDYRDVAGLPEDTPARTSSSGELIDPGAVTEVRRALRYGPPYCNEKVRPGGLTEFVIPTNRVAVVNRTYETLSPPY